jgi:hypothetical protein
VRYEHHIVVASVYDRLKMERRTRKNTRRKLKKMKMMLDDGSTRREGSWKLNQCAFRRPVCLPGWPCADVPRPTLPPAHGHRFASLCRPGPPLCEQTFPPVPTCHEKKCQTWPAPVAVDFSTFRSPPVSLCKLYYHTAHQNS